jgi:hypothetical protein
VRKSGYCFSATFISLSPDLAFIRRLMWVIKIGRHEPTAHFHHYQARTIRRPRVDWSQI